jgi:branched-chain amino acid transport system permease protein
MRAVRENERRVNVLGVNPYSVNLLAFAVAGFVAGAAGSSTSRCSAARLRLYPDTTSPSACTSWFLGGAGRRWVRTWGSALDT